MFEKLKAMPEGEERDELVRITANQMKRDLAAWGHGSMDDERVAATWHASPTARCSSTSAP